MSDAEDETLEFACMRVGKTVREKWTLDRLIGVGGMAAVYAATHRNRSRGAIKMLHPTLSVDKRLRERFLREGYVANTIEHPGVVRVIDDDVSEDGSAFLVMELLEGETLEKRRTRKGGQLDSVEVLGLADQILDVLATAHEKGIVHRDLKPENLFIGTDGRVKVLDFGIARIREGNASSATQTGHLLGTPTFMAPEQARGRWKDVDHRTDLWAVGATLFHLLTGRFVHEAETPNETLAYAMSTAAPKLRTVLPNVFEPVASLVDRALAYERNERFSNAREMQEAVREAYAAYQAGKPGTPLPVRASTPPLEPVTAIVSEGERQGAAPTQQSQQGVMVAASTQGTGQGLSISVSRFSRSVAEKYRSSPARARLAMASILLLPLAGLSLLVLKGPSASSAPAASAAASMTTAVATTAPPPMASAPPAPSVSVADLEIAPLPSIVTVRPAAPVPATTSVKPPQQVVRTNPGSTTAKPVDTATPAAISAPTGTKLPGTPTRAEALGGGRH